MMNAQQHQQLLNLVKNQNDTNNINENNIINQQLHAPSSPDINGIPPPNNNNNNILNEDSLVICTYNLILALMCINNICF